jgi:hypothetical protein
MEERSTVKKVAAVFTGSSSPAFGSEMPETSGMKLPEGKISAATRKQLLPFIVRQKQAQVVVSR